MKENQKQRHQQKRTNTTNKNTEKLTRTMTKNSSTYCTRKVQSLNDRKWLVVKKGKSKKYQTIVLVFLKMYGKGRRMQRQIYRDRFGALTKIAHFGPLGAKIAFCGLASLALRFQWFQRNFVDFGNTFFGENEARHQKTQKWWWVRHEKYILAFFSETPILTFMLQIWDRQCKNPSFPAVLGIFAHRKKKAGFTPYPTQKKMPYIKSKTVLWTTSFSAWCPKITPDISRTRENNCPGLPPRNIVKIGIWGPGLSAPHYWTHKR